MSRTFQFLSGLPKRCLLSHGLLGCLSPLQTTSGLLRFTETIRSSIFPSFLGMGLSIFVGPLACPIVATLLSIRGKCVPLMCEKGKKTLANIPQNMPMDWTLAPTKSQRLNQKRPNERHTHMFVFRKEGGAERLSELETLSWRLALAVPRTEPRWFGLGGCGAGFSCDFSMSMADPRQYHELEFLQFSDLRPSCLVAPCLRLFW